MTEHGENRAVRFGEFVLDPREERVVGPAGEVRIGRKAFRLLAALIERPGALLTKDALFETVWDGTVVSESALTATIKELRRALGDEAKNPRFIESVYGRGYRFVAPVAAAPAPTQGRPDPTVGAHPRDTDADAAARPPSRRMIVSGAVVALGAGAVGLVAIPRLVEPRPTPEVARLIASARRAMDDNTQLGQNEAIGLLRRVVDLEPRFADGWGLLGLAYAIPSHFRERREGLMLRGRARAAADRAFELDPGNGLGEVARGVELPVIGHWLERDRRVSRALADRPGDADVLWFAGAALQCAGRASAAPAFFERIGQRPFTPGTYSDYIHALWSAGRIDEAERAAGDAATLYPTQQTLWYDRYRIMTSGGRADAAIAMLNDPSARPLNIAADFLADLLADAEAVRNPGAPQARRTLDRALADARIGEFEAQAAIRLAAMLGDRDGAFAVADAFYFSRGFVIPDHPSYGSAASLDQRDTRLLFEPETASLRADPRFERLVGEIGLDAYWRQANVVPDYRARRRG